MDLESKRHSSVTRASLEHHSRHIVICPTVYILSLSCLACICPSIDKNIIFVLYLLYKYFKTEKSPSTLLVFASTVANPPQTVLRRE